MVSKRWELKVLETITYLSVGNFTSSKVLIKNRSATKTMVWPVCRAGSWYAQWLSQHGGISCCNSRLLTPTWECSVFCRASLSSVSLFKFAVTIFASLWTRQCFQNAFQILWIQTWWGLFGYRLVHICVIFPFLVLEASQPQSIILVVLIAYTHTGSMYAIYMATFTINIPQMLAYLYMDPMGYIIRWSNLVAAAGQDLLTSATNAQLGIVCCWSCAYREESNGLLLGRIGFTIYLYIYINIINYIYIHDMKKNIYIMYIYINTPFSKLCFMIHAIPRVM